MKKQFLSVFLLCLLVCVTICEKTALIPVSGSASDEKDYIKWVDFNVSYDALKDAMELDIGTFGQPLHLSWIESLSYLACRYGGNFSSYGKSDLDTFAEKRRAGKSITNLTKDMPAYDYYRKAYAAVLNGMLGLRQDGSYGLIAFSPIAAGFPYTDCDDFGSSRSYGFTRKHLGHDLFCPVGTPVTAVEDGTIEAMGWNQYGGWRIGIRSGDGQRYYYYAHLRKDTPFADHLKIGSRVRGGQLIGYSGQTGYSIRKNVNNINVPHLHFGIQLIFDESQKECLSEIWIDTYPLIRLLAENRANPYGSSSSGRSENSCTADSSRIKDSTGVKVPILMYHGLTEQNPRVGDYFLPAQTFRNDIRYLRKNGYESVTMSDLIRYVHDKTGSVRLPEKPVVITFDDGFFNNHVFGTPILEQYHMKAVISIIGKACDDSSAEEYQCDETRAVTWNELKEMQKSGVWEIQNHTYNLHKIQGVKRGASKMPGEPETDYENRLKADLLKNQQLIRRTASTSPNTFTWPYGAYTEESRAMLKRLRFKATLSCASGISIVKKGDPESLFLLKRNIRKPGTPIQQCLQEGS